MKSMIDFYRARYGEMVKGGEYASSINGPCPFCDGGRDRFIIWADKADNLGKTCMENGIKGVFWCRQCGKGGDSIEYLMSAEGLSFEEACADLGVAQRSVDAIRPHTEKKQEKPAFAGRKTEETKELWVRHAEKMAEAAAKEIRGCKSAMAYLAARGIGPEAVERYQLGFLAGENGKDCRFRPRGSFGLEAKIIGGKSRKLWIPRGITIPSRDDGGSISMFRIRRPNGDLKVRYERDAEGHEKEVKDEKYWELTGGSKASYHLRPEGARAITVYAVVEAELDAILLHAVSGESIGAVALRNASNKPDEKTHQALIAADIILLCLDSDNAGACALRWWMDNYPQARPYPVPCFKDPGDAYKGGFDLREWLMAAMPASMNMAPSKAMQKDHASMEASSGSGFYGGSGDGCIGMDGMEDEEFCRAQAALRDEHSGLLTLANLRAIRAALPRFLDMSIVPRDVMALAVLWRGVPIRYLKHAGGGWEWTASQAWRRENEDAYQRFMCLATGSKDVDEWLSCHAAEQISSVNFLKITG